LGGNEWTGASGRGKREKRDREGKRAWRTRKRRTETTLSQGRQTVRAIKGGPKGWAAESWMEEDRSTERGRGAVGEGGNNRVERKGTRVKRMVEKVKDSGMKTYEITGQFSWR